MSADAALKAQGFAQYDLARLREIFDYNEETGVLSRRSTGKDAGWKNGDGALRVTICKRKYLAHRVIWAWKTGAWPDVIIDHRDLDRTNNRWANLRAGGHSDNMGNTKARKTNKLGLKGVSRTRWGTFQVNITKHYKQRRVGSFDCPAAAHFAYIVAADSVFGEFASGVNQDNAAAFANYESMGPALLAAQPLDPPVKRRDSKWTQTFVHLEARLGALRMWRFRIWAHWAELARYILPRRYHWLVVANRMDKGGQINEFIYDSTATQAMQVCAAGLWSGLTSPSRPWFKFDKALPWVELDQDAKEWISDAEDRIYAILAKSNIYDILAQAFQDIVVFGTAPIIVYEDFKDVIRGYLPCAGEYFLADSGRLDNDTLYREFTLTVENIVGMFGAANCPEQIIKLWRAGKASLEQEYIVAHAIEPNFPIDQGDGNPFKPVSDKFPFREVYWLRGIATDQPLSMRGFNEKPFFAARWTTVSNDAYGRSLGMDALPDVKQLQLETKRKAEFIDKGVRPPMGADVSLKNEPSSIISGQVTYIPTGALAGAKQGFFPLFEPQPAWLTGITADIEMVRKRIESTFFVDVFMAITQMEGVQPRNELELTQRNLERLQVLGPFIDKFLNEVASPLLARVYTIAQRRNILKPKPQSLQNVPLKVDFVSIMTMAQRSAELVSMKDVLVTGATAANAALSSGMPNPLRVVNLDEWMRAYAELGGLKPKLLFTSREVQQHDQIHMQAMQKQQAAQAGQQLLPAVQAAHTLSQTPMGGNNALGALLGQGGGGAPGQ